jgi:hypothetical protein
MYQILAKRWASDRRKGLNGWFGGTNGAPLSVGAPTLCWDALGELALNLALENRRHGVSEHEMR